MDYTKKTKLIELLKEERQRFHHNGHSVADHDKALLYLEKGIKSATEPGELLYAIFEDFNDVYNTYIENDQ